MNRSLASVVALMLLTVPTFSASAAVVTLDLSTAAWQKYSAMGGSAAWASTADGLKFYGSGNRLITEVKSNASMDLRDATVYLKWMAHGPHGRYGAFGIGLAIDDPYSNASALSNPEVRVGLNQEIWETSGHKEVAHEQEVYCPIDGEGTPRVARDREKAQWFKPKSAASTDAVEGGCCGPCLDR